MKLVAISDLHIEGPSDPFYSKLLSLISGLKGEVTLVLAGDIFDLFVGHKKLFLDRYSRFFKTLREATESGICIHYIEGNHDFLLEECFSGLRNFHLHTDFYAETFSGKSFYFAHGDLADSSDYGYRLLRSFWRSWPTRGLIRAAPDSWVDRVGGFASHTSRKGVSIESRVPSSESIDRLRDRYRRFAEERFSEGYDYVVLGHCHDPDEFRSENRQYVNIGFPRSQSSYLEWSSGDQWISRKTLTDMKDQPE